MNGFRNLHAPIRTYAEVAAILGVEEKHVWYLEKRALDKLRKRLAPFFDEQPNASIKGGAL